MSYAPNQTSTISSDALAITISQPKEFALALQDMVQGIANYKFWSFMGLAEIRRRYKRTVIGPFWTTLSLGLFIACMGYLLSTLWHTNPKQFLPYFCSGYIAWILIQTIIIESCANFTNAASFIRQISIPYTTYACIVSWRNIIIFFHHSVILLLVLWYSHVHININILLLIPALAIIFFTGTWVGVFLGMVCARYRDIQQIVTSLLQLAMFVTPIMWQPDQLGTKAKMITNMNPLYHFISILKLPLLGQAPSMINWLVVILFSLTGACLTMLFLAKNYRKLVFWL